MLRRPITSEEQTAIAAQHKYALVLRFNGCNRQKFAMSVLYMEKEATKASVYYTVCKQIEIYRQSYKLQQE
jgi:hypothetical protein